MTMHVYTYFMKVAIDSHYRVERCSICEKIGREGGREGEDERGDLKVKAGRMTVWFLPKDSKFS